MSSFHQTVVLRSRFVWVDLQAKKTKIMLVLFFFTNLKTKNTHVWIINSFENNTCMYLDKLALEFRNHACCVCYILNLFHMVHIPHLFRNYHIQKNRCCDWSKWYCLQMYLRSTAPFDCQQCKQRETTRLGCGYRLSKHWLPSYIF